MSQENEAIAVIGMEARFPGAATVEQYWNNLQAGRECLSRFDASDLDPSIPERLRNNPAYVPVRGVLGDADRFDAAFFGISPREAEVLDPQQRVFLELAWHALENAGYAPGTSEAMVGVFAGMSNNSYFQNHVAKHPDVLEMFGEIPAMVANEKDYVATRVSYKLDLRGPSISIATACSTSLVAVCHAFNSLLDYQCDIALAGAAAVSCPQERGYLFQEGSIMAPDGKVRAFDHGAQGTVFGNGAGIVVLKRLSEALADGDTIHAVIRGAAMNNDGADKVSFTAPSVSGQAQVIELAQEFAGLGPEDIDYIETHGTGTPLGDPIEVTALTQAFRRATQRRQYCGLGSVKPAIGHLDVAAGVAGLIKLVLAVEHGKLPPTLNFEAVNPELGLEESPFYIVDRLRDWPDTGRPRRGGVSAFGLGGTNAHVVVEQAPDVAPAEARPGPHILPVSARTPEALERQLAGLADYLPRHPEFDLADVAFTLQAGRRHFEYRAALVASTPDEAAAGCRGETGLLVHGEAPAASRPVVFMFPGQGSQYSGMGAALYEHDATYREAFDACADALAGVLDYDLRDLVLGRVENADERLAQTQYTQPALFAVEYALARCWMARGVRPTALLGHSIGEFPAAAIAGVFSLEDAVRLVAERGRLMQAQPPGDMLSVRLPEAETLPYLLPGISLAAANAPRLSVVSGAPDAVEELTRVFDKAEVAYSRLRTSHAFHSPMMDPVCDAFAEKVRAVDRRPPEIPIISTVTGQALSAATATDPDYWARQLRDPVRFQASLEYAAELGSCVLLEVGPGVAASTFARQTFVGRSEIAAVESLGRPDSSLDANTALRRAAAALWCHGTVIEWRQWRPEAAYRRVPLPGYAFERVRHWLASTGPAPETEQPEAEGGATEAMGNGVSLMDRLRDTLADATGMSAAGIDADTKFVDLGLDSLFLTQFSQLLRKRFGLDLRMRQLLSEFDHLAVLAAAIENQEGEQAESSAGAADATAAPPIPGARLGRRPDGRAAWFIPDPDRPGAYRELRAQS